jgi:DnaK suppressor protein
LNVKKYQLRNVGKRDTIADKYFSEQIIKQKYLSLLLFVVVIYCISGYNSLSIKANHHKLLFELPKRDGRIIMTDLKKIKSLLQIEKKRLLEELNQLNEAGLPSEERREGSPFGKREEEATESLELEKRLAMEKRIKDQLAANDDAVRKIDTGKYGICESCGKPIEPARLEILPTARRCMNCKALQVKNAKTR